MLPCKQSNTFLKLDQNLPSTGSSLSNLQSTPSCKQDGISFHLDRNHCLQAEFFLISTPHQLASKSTLRVDQIKSFCQQAGISPTSVLYLPASRRTHYCYRIETTVYRLDPFLRQLRTYLQASKYITVVRQNLSVNRLESHQR
jgi:hypothetical protein